MIFFDARDMDGWDLVGFLSGILITVAVVIALVVWLPERSDTTVCTTTVDSTPSSIVETRRCR